MAYNTDMYCPVCKQEKNVWVVNQRHPKMCHECQEAQDKRIEAEQAYEKVAHLDLLEKTPIESRMRLLESQMYDLIHAPKTKNLLNKWTDKHEF